MLILGMQVAFDNTQLVVKVIVEYQGYISQKMARGGGRGGFAVVFQKHILFILYFYLLF